MVCNKCGADVPDGAIICPRCGCAEHNSEQDGAQTAAVVKPKSREKTIVVLAAAVAAVIAAAIAVTLAKKPDNTAFDSAATNGADFNSTVSDNALPDSAVFKSTAPNSAVSDSTVFAIRENGYLYKNAGGESYLFYNAQPLSECVPNPSGVNQSADGTAFCAVGGDRKLYYCRGTDMEIVADDVNYAVISDNGKALVYQTDDSIYYYSGSTTLIAESFYADNISIAPDGSAVVYCGYNYDEEKDSWIGCCYGWNGGAPVPLGSFWNAFVSCGGDVVFALCKDELYRITDFDGQAKELLGPCDSVLGLSADFSTVCFANTERCWVYNSALGETTSFTAYNSTLVNPADAVGVEGCGAIADSRCFVVWSEGKLIRVELRDGKYENDVLAKGAYHYRLSSDGETLAFCKSNTLYKMSILKPQNKPEKLAEDVFEFDANPDLGEIYYITNDCVLMHVKGEGKVEQVDSALPEQYIVLHNGVCVYTADGILKYTDGGSGKEYDGIGECERLNSCINAFIAYSDGYTYISQNGREVTNTNIES